MGIWKLGNTVITPSVQPFDKDTLDETLATGSLTLEHLTNEDPFEVDTLITYSEGSETLYFKVVSDLVSPVSRGQEIDYSHAISFAQTTRALSFLLIKGKSFQQPAGTTEKALYSGSGWVSSNSEGQLRHDSSPYSERLYPNAKEKTANAYVLIKKYVISYVKADSPHEGNLTKNSSQCSGVTITCRDSSENITRVISLGSVTPWAKKQISLSEYQYLDSAYSLEITVDSFHENPYTGVSADAAIYVCSAALVVEPYYFTYADILRQLAYAATPRRSSSYNDPLPYYLPTSGDFHDMLENTQAPSFPFAQGTTLFDAVSAVYKSFDAAPTLDENNVLGVDYFNNAPTAYLDSADFVGTQSSLSDKDRVNSIQVVYQNGTAGKSVFYPGKGAFAYSRSKSLGVPQNDSYVFDTPSNIQSVQTMILGKLTNVVLTFSDPGLASTVVNVLSYPDDFFDVSDYVFEKNKYSRLNIASSFSIAPTQYNSVWFSEGQRGVYFGSINETVGSTAYAYDAMVHSAFQRMAGLLGTTQCTMDYSPPSGVGSEGPWRFCACIEYIPESGGAAETESYSDKRIGQILVAQSSGLADLGKTGINSLGMALSLGEPDKRANFVLKTFAARPIKGQAYSYEGDDWYVSEATTTFLDAGVKCDVLLTKNFNKMGGRTEIDRQIRESELSTVLAKQSETIYKEYAYFSSSDYSSPAYSGHIADKFFFRALVVSPVATITNFSSALATYGAFKGNFETRGGNGTTDWLYFPLRAYAFGDAWCFECNFGSSESAGNRLEIAANWFSTSLKSVSIPYTDEKGFLDEADIRICKGVCGSSNIPLVDEPSSYAVSIDGLNLSKNGNEITSVNFEIVALSAKETAKKIIVYPRYLVSSSASGGNPPSEIRLFVNGDYSVLEQKAFGTEISCSSVFSFASVNPPAWEQLAELYDGSNVFSLPYSVSSWLIADQNGNPLIAQRGSLAAGEAVSFKVFASHDRL